MQSHDPNHGSGLGNVPQLAAQCLDRKRKCIFCDGIIRRDRRCGKFCGAVCCCIVFSYRSSIRRELSHVAGCAAHDLTTRAKWDRASAITILKSCAGYKAAAGLPQPYSKPAGGNLESRTPSPAAVAAACAPQQVSDQNSLPSQPAPLPRVRSLS